MINFKEEYNKLKTPEEKAVLFESLVSQMHDQRLKKEYAAKLDKNFQVGKSTVESPKKDNSTSKWIALIVGIASIIGLSLVAFTYLKSANSPTVIAQSYLESDYLSHPGLLKGKMQSDDELRSLAIAQYVEKKFDLASSSFSKIQAKNSDDMFFGGLSSLYSKDYPQAVQYFSSDKLVNSEFKQEINWYLGLAYLLEGDDSKSKSILEGIHTSDWKYDEARLLLEKLD